MKLPVKNAILFHSLVNNPAYVVLYSLALFIIQIFLGAKNVYSWVLYL